MSKELSLLEKAKAVSVHRPGLRAQTLEMQELLMGYLEGTISSKQARSVIPKASAANLLASAGALLLRMYRAGELVRKGKP